MKKLIALLVFLALALAAAPEAVRKVSGSIYNLWVYTEGRMAVICTGTVIQTSDGPAFLSAGHCVAEWPKARFYISQATDPDILVRVNLRWWEFQGIEHWKEGDYAVFTLPKDFKAPALPLCEDLPTHGEDVWAWTGPLGMLPILRNGTHSGELHFPDSPEDEEAVGGMMFVDIAGAPGSSGSGMLRLEKGKVCVFGVWVGGFTRGPEGAILSNIPPVLRGQ